MASTAQSVVGRLTGRVVSDSATRERARLPLWVLPVAAICLLAIYIVGYDEGTLLYAFLGESSMKFNFIHEFVHDGRHLLGFACH